MNTISEHVLSNVNLTLPRLETRIAAMQSFVTSNPPAAFVLFRAILWCEQSRLRAGMNE